MHLYRRASDDVLGEVTEESDPRPGRHIRQAPLSKPLLGMPGRVWSMVAWSLLAALLIVISIILPLTHTTRSPTVPVAAIALLLIGAGVGLVARSRTPDWWLYSMVGLWVFIICWLLTRASLIEDGVVLFGLVICAVYVGYWFPRAHVIAYAAGWSASTLVVFWTLGHFEHAALMWITAVSVSMALALFLSTLTRYLHQQAIRDPLTGLLNRTGLLGAVAEMTPQAIDAMSPLTAVVIDLDDFKGINDCHGHAAGDQTLALVANVLRRGLRVDDIVARTGGDEFVVLMPRTSQIDALAAIDRIATTSGQSWSYGSAIWHSDATLDSVLAVSDSAMYAMKAQRRLTSLDPRA